MHCLITIAEWQDASMIFHSDSYVEFQLSLCAAHGVDDSIEDIDQEFEDAKT